MHIFMRVKNRKKSENLKRTKNNILEIEIKKMWLVAMQNSGYSINTIILQLLDFNHIPDIPAPLLDTLFSNMAEYIFAYLDLGFSYLNHKNLFDCVLTRAGYTEKECSLLQVRNQSVSINRAKIRSLIGRWPASPHNSHTITEAISEIITLTMNKKEGIYYYYTAKKDGIYTALYKLTITPEVTIFQDVFNNQFYNLIEE